MYLPEIYLSPDRQEWENLLEEAVNSHCRYYASDIIQLFEMNPEDFSHALMRAERAMEILDLPIGFHVQRIYRSYTSGIGTDMKLSPLAAYVISIFTDPTLSHLANQEDYLEKRYGLR